jgi:hypothetical protein
MLAYLDNVLDPSDAEVLGKKIHDSEFATTLVNRIRTVSKKVRMDAPKVDGKGMGNDANTVAEYLDSTLPQDRVGDFERICLESDRHLAEAAGCHQVLTLVLGKPAEVPEDLREKIYALGHPDSAPAKKAASPPIPARTNGRPAKGAMPAEVPDYLRAGQRPSIWPFLATLAAAFLIGAVILRAMGPFDSSHPVARWLSGGTTVADVPPEQNVNPTPPGPPGPPENTTPTPEPTPESTEPAPDKVEPSPTETPIEPVVTTDPPARPEIPEIPDPAVIAPKPEGAPVPETTPVPPAPMPPVAAPPAAGTAMDVGRYISDEQILATLNPDDGLWYLKEPRGVLSAGERLLVLPTYRPQVALPSGVQVTWAGESSAQMHEPGEAGASRMFVDYGKFVIVTVGAAGAQIELNLAGIEGMATLVDADSALAVKVSRWVEPGKDPSAAPGMPVVELFATSGVVTWRQAGQEKIEIPANHVLQYVGADPPELCGPFFPPDWIDSRSISGIDRETSIVLHDLIAAELAKPLNLSLQERLTDRRVNVRALIARCLGNLDEFEPILKDLADPKLASYWAAEVDVLRQAILRSPETAGKLHVTIERAREKDAPILIRLIWGFNAEDLEKAGALQLVKHLKHDEMDVRVLTFLNLIDITGAQEFYRPEKKPDLNAAAIRNWESRLDKGTIAYKSPPSPLETYKPMPKAPGLEPPAAPRPLPPAAAPPLEAGVE